MKRVSLELIKEGDEWIIIDPDTYYTQESAIYFTLGHPMTDLPESMLLETAMDVLTVYNDKINAG